MKRTLATSLAHPPFLLLIPILLLLVTTIITTAGANVINAHLDPAYGHVAPSCNFSAPPKTTTSLTTFLHSITPTDTKSTVVIPCGHEVTVDANFRGVLPSGLRVEGHLHFADGGDIRIALPHLLVRGLFTIGTEAKPHESRLEIELIDDGRTATGARSLTVANLAPFNPYDTLLSFGMKAFVVYGGAVRIFGAVSGPQFVRLDETVVPGVRRLRVDVRVDDHWRPGDVVAIASSTIPFKDTSSTGIIEQVFRNDNGSSTIVLERPLRIYHTVRRVGLTDGTRRLAVLAPEVVRLNRNIVIRGMQASTDLDAWLDAGKAEPVGGHFIIAHSAQQQVVQGVEFAAMGQAGKLGRYPLHVHFAGDVVVGSRLSENSIHHSKQRCVVVHATNHLTIERNVAFRTCGHCYMTEDGLEHDNRFVGNVGMATRNAIQLIATGARDVQTDDRPATFWLSAPNNHLFGNVAAGSQSAGFWYELHPRVRGASRDAKLPGWRDVELQKGTFGRFVGNVAHSATLGLATYPIGSFPIETAVFDGLFVWTVHFGWATPAGSNQMLRGAVMVDVYSRGVSSHHIEGHQILDTTIVGELHNERACNARVRGRGTEGIHMEVDESVFSWYTGMRGIVMRNVHLQGLDGGRNCKQNVGIVVKMAKKEMWYPSATTMDAVTFDTVDENIQFDFSSNTHRQVAMHYNNVAMPALSGSGYLVSGGFTGSKVLLRGCVPMVAPNARMQRCEGQCWRHVSVAYDSIKGYEKETVSLKFTLRDGTTFIEKPEKNDRWAGTPVRHVVSKVLPAGLYRLQLVNAKGQLLPAEAYSKWTFVLIRPDARKGPASCEGEVDFLVHGRYVPEAQ